MSTIKVDTIKNTSNVEVFTAKAWVNFNGTGTVAISGSGNVTSITDNGAGDYTVNFTSAMPDANYSAIGVTQENRVCGIAYGFTATPLTTTSARFLTALANGSYTQTDPTGISVAIFR